MKKVLAICCSDILGIPALLALKQRNILAAVITTDKTGPLLLPIFASIGIADNDIYILTKKNLEIRLIELIELYSPDALLSFTFSWMIPNTILNSLPQRCINFHFGLLPKYKGADPLFWQLKNGEQRCGITVHVMTNELDAGPVIMKEEIAAIPGETYGLNAQRLGALAAQMVMKVVAILGNDTFSMSILPDEPALFLKKPASADLLINWQQQSAAEIECLVNAANPRYGGALTSLRQMPVRILEVSPVDVNNPSEVVPGTIVHADVLYGLIVACLHKQYIKINVVQINEGFFSGIKLFNLGFHLGEMFV